MGIIGVRRDPLRVLFGQLARPSLYRNHGNLKSVRAFTTCVIRLLEQHSRRSHQRATTTTFTCAQSDGCRRGRVCECTQWALSRGYGAGCRDRREWRVFSCQSCPKNHPTRSSRRLEKRARRNIVRPVPQRLRKSEAIWVFGETAVKDSGDGFKFKGHFYDKNGFRIIGLRHYSVVETTPSLQHISIFLDAAIEEIEVDHLDPKKPDSTSKPIKPIKDYSDDDIFQIANIDPLQLAAESYLNIGNVVEVFEGAQRGMLGRVVSVATNGTIQICETKHSETRSPPLLVDLSLREVRLFLSVGESVSVKYGVFAGRVGVVEVVNGAHLVVRERGSFDEVSEAQHLCSKAC